ELEKKYADKDRMLMRDSATFSVLVKESGFVLKGAVEVDGKASQKIDSQVSGADDSVPEPVNVPYDGRLFVWVDGVAESYEVSLPSDAKLGLGEAGRKVADVKKGERVEIVPEDFDSEGSSLVFSGVTVSARNVAGESEVISIGDLIFSVDPCAAIVIAKGGGTEFGPYEISKEDVEIPLEVKNGIGPFKWQVLSDVKPVDYVDLNEEDAAKVFNKRAMEDLTGIDMRVVEGRAYLFSKGIGYSRIEDAAMKRWELICRDEKDSESCRKALIKGDLNYKNVTRLLGSDGEEGLSYDDLNGKPMEFKESIFVEVKDEGCQAKLVAKNSLKVTIPGPEKEVLGDAYISYKVGQEGSWGGADGTHANLQLWSKDEKLIETGKKNVRKAWDEQIKKYHWNRPAFPSLTDLGDRPVFDIDRLVIRLWREWHASWEMEFDIVQFHVVGKNWYYFDDTDYNCTQGAHPSGAKECEIPMDLKKAEKGKWYLRCNPNDSDPKSESCGYSVK
ncbi:MAG TPA: hypothetical protein PLZ86_03380, partial [bacterium]|nr:hypothetical protein [bacterium]